MKPRDMISEACCFVLKWHSFSKDNNDWLEALNILKEGKISIKELITHRIKIEKIYDAIKMMASHQEFYSKVMIENEK